MNDSGWTIDLQAVYGAWFWRTRARFGMTERLYESPDRSCAVLLFGIDEVGVNKQVGRLALLKDKAAPRVAWTSRWTKFWYEGVEEPVVFDADRGIARVYEFRQNWWTGGMSSRERLLDLRAERLLPA